MPEPVGIGWNMVWFLNVPSGCGRRNDRPGDSEIPESVGINTGVELIPAMCNIVKKDDCSFLTTLRNSLYKF